jgi:hypothetical protein
MWLETKPTLLSAIYILLLLICARAISMEMTKRVDVNPNLSTSNVLELYIVEPVSKVKILPHTFPLPVVNRSKLTLMAAKGEYEPVSFVVRSPASEIDGLQIKSGNLASSNGSIPAVNVDIKVVKPWYQANGAWVSIGRPLLFPDQPVLVPELLLNNDNLVQVDYIKSQNFIEQTCIPGKPLLRIDLPNRTKKREHHIDGKFCVEDSSTFLPVRLPKNYNKQFWVTVHVPADAEPGSYTGKITLSLNASEINAIDVDLTVLPFELAKSRLKYSLYYKGRLHPDSTKTPAVSSDYKSPDQLKIEFDDMSIHGVTNAVVYQSDQDGTLFSQYLEIRNKSRLENNPLYLVYLATIDNSPVGMESLRKRIRKVKNITSRFGINDIYVYGRDEARGKELVEQREIWRLVHSEHAKVFAAGGEEIFEKMGDLLDLVVFARAPVKDEADKFHFVGKQIYSYANPPGGVENPYLYRLNYGLNLWASGFDGAMVYAYQDSMGDGWNDFDFDMFRDHNFTYPTMNGVISTLAWEGFREGVDDVRYINTLELRLNNYKNEDNKNVAAARSVSAAREYIETLRNKLQKLNSYGSVTRESSIDLGSIRRDVIGYIMAIGE